MLDDRLTSHSHCPWVDNCVGVNNHKHFILYVLFMIAGIALLIRLTLVCKYHHYATRIACTDRLQDIEMLPAPQQTDCHILEEALCREFSKDPFTIITNAWASLQLIWTFMLIFVHLTQIARAVTTYETMRGQTQVGPLMAAVTTGTTSTGDAQVNGPSPPHKKKEGCLSQWSKLLGLDTFLTIAFQGYKGAKEPRAPRAPKNPFTRGMFRNCQDFWMDGPVFGRKNDGESNKALLGGDMVDYACMYDVPKGGMRYRGGGYEAVPAAEEGEV